MIHYSGDGLKSVLSPMRAALYDFDAASVQRALADSFAENAVLHISHPFGDLSGPAELFEQAYLPLANSFPDLERRDLILAAGQDPQGADWVGACGIYMGSFLAPFLAIPATGQPAGFRYHEFFRIEDGRIVEMQAIWDLPELMMQAGVWPMGPSLGRDWLVPGPASQDGLADHADTKQAEQALQIVLEMLAKLTRHPQEGGPEIMQLEKFWHPHLSWYGPAGIGTARGINGFRAFHQIPFLAGMPDRRGGSQGLHKAHFFAEGPYVAVTGWPNMQAHLSGDGWLGMIPAGQKITLRSLDFWRVEKGLIRENWVLVDLLDVWHQLGVDVFRRMEEYSPAGRLARLV